MQFARDNRHILAGVMTVFTLSAPVVAVSALVAMVHPAAAQEALPAPAIVVVDTAEAMNRSKAMQGIRAQFGKYEAQFRQQVSADEKALNQTAQDLERQRSLLSADAFAQKKRDFEMEVANYQRRSRALRLALEKSNRIAVNEVNKAMVEVTGAVAQAKGANIVLSNTQMVLFDPRMNVTALVIEQLNAKLPSVSFPVPVAESAATNGKK